MDPLRRRSYALIAALACAYVAPVAHAGMFADVAVGLGTAGFDIRGGRNVLSDGGDLLVANVYNGEVFDFGVAEFSLAGPLSLDISTSNRLLPSLDIALTTAIDGRSAASPLSYDFTYDVGGQRTDVTGSLLMDAKLSINQFGWYDLGVTYSSRQAVDNEGRFSNGVRENDFDIGPINVRGNIFADMLAAVTAPFFDAANAPNIFASFSGREQLKRIVEERANDAVASLVDGDSFGAGADARSSSSFPAVVGPFAPSGVAYATYDPTGGADHADGSGASARRSNDPIADALLAGRTASTDGATTQFDSTVPATAPNAATGVVPEPTVLVLMLLGIPALVARRRHNIRS